MPTDVRDQELVARLSAGVTGLYRSPSNKMFGIIITVKPGKLGVLATARESLVALGVGSIPPKPEMVKSVRMFEKEQVRLLPRFHGFCARVTSCQNHLPEKQRFQCEFFRRGKCLTTTNFASTSGHLPSSVDGKSTDGESASSTCRVYPHFRAAACKNNSPCKSWYQIKYDRPGKVALIKWLMRLVLIQKDRKA